MSSLQYIIYLSTYLCAGGGGGAQNHSKIKYLLGFSVSRAILGLPTLWLRVMTWLLFCGPTWLIPTTEQKEKPRKHENIPILHDYRKKPGKDFWKQFPVRNVPKTAETKINVSKLEKLLKERREFLTNAQYKRGMKVVQYLTDGAPSFQKNYLPPIMCRNNESSYENGPMLTDAIADWSVEGFVAGPFDSPPVKDFRSNPLKVVVQHGKARPILNVSSPIGASFNDNIDETKLERIEMSSPSRFGQSVIKAGKNAWMSKFDMRNAYKNIPCKVKDLRLQGFEWYSKYFIETTQMFGARTSVSNFDILGNTIMTLAKTFCEIPGSLVHRQLDDVPVVGPSSKNWCQEFSKKYEESLH